MKTMAARMCTTRNLVRLDKLLADRSNLSRKAASQLIRSGCVTLDGEQIAEAKLRVPWSASPTSINASGVTRSYPPPPLLAAYYKPFGVHSTMSDERGRPDLAAALPTEWRKALHPVGRLDADTTGLLLFSRDGILRVGTASNRSGCSAFPHSHSRIV